MNIVFMGTSVFAVPSLINLVNSSHKVVGVVSQPDRPKGRGKKIVFTPVKEAAQKFGLSVYQPSDIKDVEAISYIYSLKPDLIVVASYGQIISSEILEYPHLGCINVHASLLPKYRGAAPVQRALMAGEKVTGVTIMFMDKGLDTGDIITQTQVDIDDVINHGELEMILAQKGARLLMDTIAEFQNGHVRREKQDDSKVIYAPMLQRNEEIIDWSNSAVIIHNKIRAMNPIPGAYFSVKGVRIKVFKSRIIDDKKSGVIAQIVELTDKGFIVQTGEGTIEILEVQKEGKKRMLSCDFLKGFNLTPGTLLINQGG